MSQKKKRISNELLFCLFHSRKIEIKSYEIVNFCFFVDFADTLTTQHIDSIYIGDKQYRYRYQNINIYYLKDFFFIV